MAASNWTGASDVAPTLAPVNSGQRQSTLPDHRSMAAVYGGDRRSMVAVNDGPRWRTIVDHLRTTVDHHRTTVDHHRTTGQRLLTASQEAGKQAGSGHGLVQSRSGSGCHVDHSESATSACWSHVSPRGSATSADWVLHVHVATTSAADVAEWIYNPPAESNQRPCV
nr:hypothetical protein [Tanacetum cinerariifolium]